MYSLDKAGKQPWCFSLPKEMRVGTQNLDSLVWFHLGRGFRLFSEGVNRVVVTTPRSCFEGSLTDQLTP